MILSILLGLVGVYVFGVGATLVKLASPKGSCMSGTDAVVAILWPMIFFPWLFNEIKRLFGMKHL